MGAKLKPVRSHTGYATRVSGSPESPKRLLKRELSSFEYEPVSRSKIIIKKTTRNLAITQQIT